MKELIDKYVNGRVTEAERREMEAWLRAHPEALEKYFSETEWDALNYAPASNPLLPADLMDTTVFPDRTQHIRRKRLLYAISSVAACAACVFLFFTIGKLRKEDKQPIASAVLKNQPIVYSNTTTAISTVQLPDSSVVKLSPQSAVTIQADYNTKNRQVEMSGEAVFYVHKDPEHRFIVSSGNVKTTALGTIFRVIHPATGNISVHLIEGKILVEEKGNNDKTYYLLPGKTIAYEMQTRTFTLSNDNKEAITASNNAAPANHAIAMEPVKPAVEHAGIVYKNEEMVFTDVRLSDVLKQLARDYQVNIAYPMDKVSKIRVAGSINKSQDIRKTLSDIAAMNKFRLEEDTLAQKFTFY